MTVLNDLIANTEHKFACLNDAVAYIYTM